MRSEGREGERLVIEWFVPVVRRESWEVVLVVIVRQIGGVGAVERRPRHLIRPRVHVFGLGGLQVKEPRLALLWFPGEEGRLAHACSGEGRWR